MDRILRKMRQITSVHLELELSPDRVNGTYPVALNIQAREADGERERFAQVFTVYVTVTDGKDPNAVPPAEIPPSQPKLIIARYSINPDPVTAGEEFEAAVTILNTSSDRAVKNLRITAGGDPASLIPLNETDTYCFPALAPGSTLELELRYRVRPDTPIGAQTVSLAMDYEDADASAVSASGEIVIQVRQAARVEASVPDLPREVRAGDTLPLSLNVMNLGKNTIYNVRYTVEGPGLLSSGPAFIGNMEAGTAKAGDMNIFIGTRDMSEGYEGTERYGRTEGILTLVYEDETGEEAAQTFEITTTIREPLFGEEEESPEDKPETAGQWWISILIGGLTIAGLAGILILRRRQERRGQEKKGYEIF